MENEDGNEATTSNGQRQCLIIPMKAAKSTSMMHASVLLAAVSVLHSSQHANAFQPTKYPIRPSLQFCSRLQTATKASSTPKDEFRIQKSTPTSSDNHHLLDAINDAPIVRATEILGVATSQFFAPVLLSLLLEGLPKNWYDFWSRTSDGKTNGERVAIAMEALGPTYVKFGQALASRPDIVPQSLASKLEVLQDDMKPFPTETAKTILESELLDSSADPDKVRALIDSLSPEPVAAASVGQVYKGTVPGFGEVAVKVQRPGIRRLVQRDATLLRTVATCIEAIPSFSSGPKNRLVATELVSAVDEFMTRIFEELDYRNEAKNAQLFADLYCSKKSSAADDIAVIVPEILLDFCTENVLVLEWIDGVKLTNLDENQSKEEYLQVIQQGIRCTLRQLLVDGVLHADPHAGNLLKVQTADNSSTLGYLDFGIVATIEPQVRDALVCSITQLVFNRDYDAIAALMGELQLLPPQVMEDPVKRAQLSAAMEKTLSSALLFPKGEDGSTKIPVLLFDKLLDALVRLVPEFQFQLPPYFINNARGLSTLEGIARTLDPSFNVLQVMYPYALTIMLENPSGSAVVDRSLQSLLRNPETGRLSRSRIRKVIRDSALLSGYSQTRVVTDVLKTAKGRKLSRDILTETLQHRLLSPSSSQRKHKRSTKTPKGFFKL